MILDWNLMFTGTSPAAFTDSPTTGTQTSTNVIDLGLIGGIPASAAGGGGARDIGVGDHPAMNISVLVTTTFTGGTSLQVNLQGAPDAGSNTPGAYTTMWNSPVVAEAALLQGVQLGNVDMPRPVPGQALPRYLRLQYVTVGTHGAGAIAGNIVLDRDDQILGTGGIYSGYPAGINIAN